MFKQKSNATFNNILFSFGKISAMHEQMERLYGAAKDLKQIEGQSAVARFLNESPQTVKNWETRGVSRGGAIKAQQLIGCSAVWIQYGKGNMAYNEGDHPQIAPPEIDLENNPDYPAIRKVRFKLSAGAAGFGVDYDGEDHAPIVFGKYWYEVNKFRPEALFAVRVVNGSMEPGLYSGDIVVVNTLSNQPKDGNVFAVNYEGEMVVKRLIRDEGDWWLHSDNPDQMRYKRKRMHEDCHIIGEIVQKQSMRI